jgi:hypothetical protein
MEQKTDLEVGGAQVVEHLSLCSPVKFVSRFGLDDELVVDDHVQALVGELFAFVHDADADLSQDPMAAVSQLDLEGSNVHMLEESIAKRVVHLEKRLRWRSV